MYPIIANRRVLYMYTYKYEYWRLFYNIFEELLCNYIFLDGYTLQIYKLLSCKCVEKKKKNTTCEHFCSTSNNYLKTTYYLFKI